MKTLIGIAIVLLVMIQIDHAYTGIDCVDPLSDYEVEQCDKEYLQS